VQATLDWSACFATVPDLGELIDLGQQGEAKDILGRVYEYTLCAEWNG
jgi:hypothetical protein